MVLKHVAVRVLMHEAALRVGKELDRLSFVACGLGCSAAGYC